MNETTTEDPDWGANLSDPVAGGVQKADEAFFQDLNDQQTQADYPDIEFILDIPIKITVELGRTKMPIKNLLQLTQGSVIELDGLAGEAMDILVNGCLIAHGEVVVVNDNYGIRLTDIISPSERIQRLNR